MHRYCVSQPNYTNKSESIGKERGTGAHWAARIDELIDCRRQKSRGESYYFCRWTSICNVDIQVAERKLDQYHV